MRRLAVSISRVGAFCPCVKDPGPRDPQFPQLAPNLPHRDQRGIEPIAAEVFENGEHFGAFRHGQPVEIRINGTAATRRGVPPNLHGLTITCWLLSGQVEIGPPDSRPL